MCTKGVLSKEWERVQYQWSQTLYLRHDPSKWKMVLIKGIHNFTQAMWNKRNLILHGDHPSNQLEICKSNCWRRMKELSIADKKLFQLPLNYQCKGTVAGMTLWIDRGEMVFQ